MSDGRAQPFPDPSDDWVVFVDDVPVDELDGLNTRAVNDLKRGEVFTARDLALATEEEISGIRGVGRAGLERILAVRGRVVGEAVETSRRSVPSVPVEFMGLDFQTAMVLQGNGLSTSTQVAAFAAKHELTELREVGESRADQIRAALVRLREHGKCEGGPGPVGWREQVAEELRAGEPAVLLARKYGISQSLIVAIKDEFDMSRPKGAPNLTPKREELERHRDAIVAALSAGAPKGGLAELFGVSRATFRLWLGEGADTAPAGPLQFWLQGETLKEFIADFESGRAVLPGAREVELRARCRQAAEELDVRLRGIADLEERLVEAEKFARRGYYLAPSLARIRARRAYAVRVLRHDFGWPLGRIRDRMGVSQDSLVLRDILDSDRDLPQGGRPEGLKVPPYATVGWFAELAAKSHRRYEEAKSQGVVARKVREECVKEMLGSGRWGVAELAVLTKLSKARIVQLGDG